MGVKTPANFLLECADEFQRADHEECADDDAGNSGPPGCVRGLNQSGTGQDAPGTREQVAEVFADSDSEVAVERLEDNVDGFATCRTDVDGSIGAR